tara:strand:- start:1101 stop:1634 length:534 start_codon:yes stop_codon:yes gene_type:complete
MAEVFTNALKRSAGIVTTSSAAAIGANATTITGISTVGVSVGDMVDTQHFRGGTKVSVVGVGQVTVDKTSTNSAASATQIVRFLGPSVAYTSPAGIKSILIGGTFANLTNNSVNIFIEVSSGSTSTNIVNDIPVPTGSSFVISDSGKTVLLENDVIRIYCDTAAAIDATLGILQGVS